MAAGTVDRDSAGRSHHLRDHVVEIISPSQAFQDGTWRFGLSDKIPGTCGQESGRCDSVGIVRTQHITRNLITQELIIRHVCIDRPDDPVAIVPCIVPPLIAFKSMRVSIVRDVQPVPRPSFAVMGRR